MKLSNKILIIYFGVIFFYMTAVFAEIRLRGNPSLLDDLNTTMETVEISGIKHLVLNDLDQNIYIVGSDEPRIEVRSVKGDLLKKLKYTIIDDTLTLSELEREEKEGIHITVYISENSLEGITVNGARVDIEGVVQEKLSITQNAGHIRIIGANRFQNLHIMASNEARFEILAAEVETLSADIDDSEAHIYTPVQLLKGSLKNNSFMRMTGVDEIQFKKDKSSVLHFY